MFFSNLRLTNWRNFGNVGVALEQERMFVVGPNASGKSNFLDVFRFLSDIARPGGGLQKAVMDRGGMSTIRNFSAPGNTPVEIEVEIKDTDNDTVWTYELHLESENDSPHKPLLAKEKVTLNERIILDRPGPGDRDDEISLTQTSLEQVMANKDFRPLVSQFVSIDYLHMVPQFFKIPQAFSSLPGDADPYGMNFMEQLSGLPGKTRARHLEKLEGALKIAVPQLSQLKFVKDQQGTPHLEVLYNHWSPGTGGQIEKKFSDGTLRLVGLLWMLIGSESMLLLEEPELSLHDVVVEKLPALMYRLKRKKCQVFLSTHSRAILSDKGIGGEEILVLTPGPKGTTVTHASTMEDIKILLQSGMSAADAVIPLTAPKDIHRLDTYK